MDDIMFSYYGTKGRRGSALCNSLERSHWPSAGHCGPLARWLGGQTCWACRGVGQAGRLLFGGWTRLLPVTVVHQLLCALSFMLVVSCATRAKLAIYDYLVYDGNAWPHAFHDSYV